MESWQLDFEWLQVQTYVKRTLGRDKLPDLQAILFLIGVQELGRVEVDTFSKEEKRDLIHVAVCSLLEPDGYYEYIGRDQDGWPHYKQIKIYDQEGLKEQETYLKQKVIAYMRPNILSSPEVLN